jgi:Ni/Co efflux regulator RcnB
MRHLLISVAALALSAGAAFAQPDQGHGRGHERGQNAGQPEAAQQPAPQQQGTWSRDPNRPMQGQPPRTAQGGGPTNFTNQIQGHQPDQGQGRGDRGNWQSRGDRGNWQERGMQAAPAAPQQQAIAPSQNPQDQNRRGERDNFRGYREGRGNEDRAANGGRYEGRHEYDNRGGYGEGRRGYDNPAWDRYASRPGNPAFNGGRFNGFRDFHRDYRAEHRFHVGGYRRPYGWYSHHWAFGEFLPRPFWARDYWLVDYADYDLPPPPYGAVWVRVDEDALLIDRDSGEIITVVYNVFY